MFMYTDRTNFTDENSGVWTITSGSVINSGRGLTDLSWCLANHMWVWAGLDRTQLVSDQSCVCGRGLTDLSWSLANDVWVWTGLDRTQLESGQSGVGVGRD